MVSGLSASAEAFLAGLERANQAMTRAQEQLTSGTRIQRASDAPEKAADLLLLTTQIGRNQQVQSNIGRLKAEVDTAEQALQTAVNLVDRAISVGAQGSNSVEVVENRQWLSQEIQGLLETMVSISATTVQGRHIFAGDDRQTAPYALDPTSPTGVAALTTAANTVQFEDSTGIRTTIGLSAGEIFDARDASDNPAAGNVFAALNNLRVALDAKDHAGVLSAMDQLHSAGDHLNAQLQSYGAWQNQLDRSEDIAKKFRIQLETRRTEVKDADAVAAALTLTQARTQVDAAMSARAQMPHSSLFDFLR
jgi:flagellar hook-associated protein 3 FlgL